eukprot:TRINITY_DN25958_c0_g1_i1.p4 TRINITY_DN25958_c0_g1~~TRINITY_DN25958_c0_g1_i1.p4  ORF type:complete len:121 (+),score=2.58 TRINITY_DN25958_c0_g1_i1:1103-1465(+)
MTNNTHMQPKKIKKFKAIDQFNAFQVKYNQNINQQIIIIFSTTGSPKKHKFDKWTQRYQQSKISPGYNLLYLQGLNVFLKIIQMQYTCWAQTVEKLALLKLASRQLISEIQGKHIIGDIS